MNKPETSLFRPVDAASLIFFRIGLGGIIAWWAWDYLTLGRVKAVYVDPVFHFTYYGLDWVKPLPGNGMYLLFFAVAILGIAIAAGIFYRFAAFCFATIFTYVFLIERTNYQNHYYLLALISWWLPFLPLNRFVSWDARGIQPKTQVFHAWILWIVRFHIGLPYFMGGLAKMHPDWIHGFPLREMLAMKSDLPVIGTLFLNEFVIQCFIWGGMLFDLAVVPLLLYRRTRFLAYAVCICFHLLNSILFNIHIFPWFMIFASTIFFEPDWPRRILGGTGQLSLAVSQNGASSRMSRALWIGLVCYCSFHLAWPFRHHLFPGDAAWTEQGHYFSWRMMLRARSRGCVLPARFGIRQGTGTRSATVRDARTNRQVLARPRDDSSPGTRIAADYEADSSHNAAIYGLVLTSLNGRKPQLMIDPTKDLSLIARGQSDRPYVMPLTEPLRSKPWDLPITEWEKHVSIPKFPFESSRTSKTNLSRSNSVSHSKMQRD